MLANALISPGITLPYEYQIRLYSCYYCLFSLSVCQRRAFPVSWRSLSCSTIMPSEVCKQLTLCLVKHFFHLWNRRREDNRILSDSSRICRTDQISSSTYQTSKHFNFFFTCIDCISVRSKDSIKTWFLFLEVLRMTCVSQSSEASCMPGWRCL